MAGALLWVLLPGLVQPHVHAQISCRGNSAAQLWGVRRAAGAHCWGQAAPSKWLSWCGRSTKKAWSLLPSVGRHQPRRLCSMQSSPLGWPGLRHVCRAAEALPDSFLSQVSGLIRAWRLPPFHRYSFPFPFPLPKLTSCAPNSISVSAFQGLTLPPEVNSPPLASPDLLLPLASLGLLFFHIHMISVLQNYFYQKTVWDYKLSRIEFRY